jgi:hypothetical protein
MSHIVALTRETHPMSFSKLALVPLLPLALAVWAGCSSGGDATNGDDENATGAGCQVFSERDQRALTKDELAKLNDPVATLLLKTGTCPTSFTEIQAKLRKTDTGGCADDPKKPPAGTTTRFVSERSQDLGKADVFRAVVTRACSGRSDHELFISLFGVQTSALPSDVEVIGEDKTKGVFDYYAREDGKWKFFGSSEDLLSDGYDCENGACVPRAAVKTRCASCHVGGGLNMKELHTPWVHWEGATSTPGTADLINKFGSLLGTSGTGVDMENKVTTANHDDWIPRRIEFLKTKGLEEVLRPLFCTIDVNLESQGIGGPGGLGANLHKVVTNVSSSLLVDDTWQVLEAVSVNDADYQALIKTNNQRIVDSSNNKPMKSAQGAVTDTFFAFTFPERSQQDLDYVAALISKGIIDDEFAKDVLAVDFTRPIFSADRCGLLGFAPKLDAAAMKPAAIRDGFNASLANQSSDAAKALLANLSATGNASAHVDAVRKFIDACKARPSKDFLSDVLVYASHLRNALRAVHSPKQGEGGQGIIEFAETLPVDDVADSDKAFDPATCVLK